MTKHNYRLNEYVAQQQQIIDDQMPYAPHLLKKKNMKMSVDNGSQRSEIQQSLANRKTISGNIFRNAQQRGGDRQLGEPLRSISQELGQYVKQGQSDYMF